MDAITILPFCTIEAHDSEPFTTDTSVWLFSTFVHVRQALFSSLKEYNGGNIMELVWQWNILLARVGWKGRKKRLRRSDYSDREGGRRRSWEIKCWNSYRDFALCTKIHFFLFSFFFSFLSFVRMKLCLPERTVKKITFRVVEKEFPERCLRPEHGTTFTGDANEASNPCANIKEPFPPFENGSPVKCPRQPQLNRCSKFLADKFKMLEYVYVG